MEVQREAPLLPPGAVFIGMNLFPMEPPRWVIRRVLAVESEGSGRSTVLLESACAGFPVKLAVGFGWGCEHEQVAARIV